MITNTLPEMGFPQISHGVTYIYIYKGELAMGVIYSDWTKIGGCLLIQKQIKIICYFWWKSMLMVMVLNIKGYVYYCNTQDVYYC
jgi:hypothetical protein